MNRTIGSDERKNLAEAAIEGTRERGLEIQLFSSLIGDEAFFVAGLVPGSLWRRIRCQGFVRPCAPRPKRPKGPACGIKPMYCVCPLVPLPWWSPRRSLKPGFSQDTNPMMLMTLTWPRQRRSNRVIGNDRLAD